MRATTSLPCSARATRSRWISIPPQLPALPQGWVRDYFFAAHGYEKDMDFYAYRGETVEPLPFRAMGTYPYPEASHFPADPEHLNYLLEYNTRFMSGNEAGGYSFRYPRNKLSS